MRVASVGLHNTPWPSIEIPVGTLADDKSGHTDNGCIAASRSENKPRRDFIPYNHADVYLSFTAKILHIAHSRPRQTRERRFISTRRYF